MPILTDTTNFLMSGEHQMKSMQRSFVAERLKSSILASAYPMQLGDSDKQWRTQGAAGAMTPPPPIHLNRKTIVCY